MLEKTAAAVKSQLELPLVKMIEKWDSEKREEKNPNR